MFPLQQNDELVFQILSNDPRQQGKISQDLIVDYASLESSHMLNIKNTRASTTKKRKLPRKVLGRNNSYKSDEITASDDFELKKIMHRDIERQRRQEMATLYSSLRSLLPIQYLKGKRSVSDHLYEAVNYIKQLQENMNNLERRRDQLNMLPNYSNPSDKENGSSDDSSVSTDHCITVSQCHGGIEILINSNCRGKNIPLSRVLQELMKEGLDVVSCVSSKVNQNSLHRIQSEACDMKCINLHALERKLIDVINVDL